jgi:hypothetical protein
MIIIRERASLEEMAIISSSTDQELGDFAIAVYSGEHPPMHATILKKSNHKISFGRFKITIRPPKSHTDIQEVKEPIEAKYKRQVFAWAGRPNKFIKGETNWRALNTIWNILNH